MIRDVSDLEVYREAFVYLEKLYLLLAKIPKSEYNTVIQCKKCSKSIVANLAEGFAKRSSEKEFKRFLKIAIGSSDEIVTHLRTVLITVPELKLETQVLIDNYIVISKRLNKLHSVWKSGIF